MRGWLTAADLDGVRLLLQRACLVPSSQSANAPNGLSYFNFSSPDEAQRAAALLSTNEYRVALKSQRSAGAPHSMDMYIAPALRANDEAAYKSAGVLPYRLHGGGLELLMGVQRFTGSLGYGRLLDFLGASPPKAPPPLPPPPPRTPRPATALRLTLLGPCCLGSTFR